MSDGIVRAKGLTKRFGEFTAVDDLTIEVERGSIFAFLGANGSGKSTTIRMLIGLLQPTSGTIEVDGVDVIAHPRRVRDRIGYMGQKVSLYTGLSLRENVEFYGGLYGLSVDELGRRWSAVRDRFDLGEVETEQAEDLPAGMRQRAGLALAILHKPRLLFLDEPTAGADVHSRELFWELIQEESRAGVTVFVTTHFLDEAEYCDWVSFIDSGRLIANAPPEDLREKYSRGYRIEIGLSADERPAVRERFPDLSENLRETAGGLELRVRALDSAVLKRLEEVTSRFRSGVVRIHPASMNDVFRGLLTANGGEKR